MADVETRRVPAGTNMYQGPSLEEPFSSKEDVRVWRVGATGGSIAVVVEGGGATRQELYIPASVYLDLPL